MTPLPFPMDWFLVVPESPPASRQPTPDPVCGAVVLCGGGSRRMGRDKAWLPFGDETLLQRAVRTAAAAVGASQVVVVAAAGQALPPLPSSGAVVRDLVEGAGPLPAVAVGLEALAASTAAEAAFVTACDAPLTTPAAIRAMLQQLARCEPPCLALAPRVDGRWHPLAAVYWLAAAARLRAAALAGVSSLQRVLPDLGAIPVGPDRLRALDPTGGLLANCNTPQEYEATLERASRPGG